jgi:signal transduction histidine kinase
MTRGVITVKSVEGEGTVFRVELPLARELVAA